AKALNNFRFAFNRTFNTYIQNTVPDPGPQFSFVPGQPIGLLAVGGATSGGVSARSITSIGAASGQGLFLWGYNIFQTGDDFTYVTGRHSLKGGVEIERMQDNYLNSAFLRGAYTFTNFTTFLAGTPASLQVATPLGAPPFRGLRQTLYAAYAQDDFT